MTDLVTAVNPSSTGTSGFPLAADQNEITAFVDLLFKHSSTGDVVLRSFLRTASGGTSVRDHARVPVSDRQRLIAGATAAATQAANLPGGAWTFAPPVATFRAGGRTTEADIAEAPTLSADLDEADPDAARATLEALLGPATAVVASGGVWRCPTTGRTAPKLHLHWRLAAPATTPEEIALLKRVRKAAAQLVGGDASGAPASHPYRWVGSWHLKGRPTLARIVGGDPSAEIDLHAAASALGVGTGASAGGAVTPVLSGFPPVPPAVAAEVAKMVRGMSNAVTDYSAWLEVVHAIKTGLGGDETHYQVYEDWCLQWPENTSELARQKWDSFNAPATSLPGVEYFAMRYGDWSPFSALPWEPREIKVTAGDLPSIVTAAERAIADPDAATGVFQRGGMLVRAVQVPAKSARGETICAQRLQPVTAAVLTEILGRCARWGRYDARAKKLVRCDAPPQVAQMLIERGQWPTVPVLTGVISAPTLRHDGTGLDREGYDAQTGLLLDFGGASFPQIPSNPSQADALAALNTLRALLAGFAFAGPADEAVALACLLTATVRRSLPTAPLFAFSAPTAGSGKSLLVDLCAVISTGRLAPAMAAGGNADETEKRLAACLLAGDAVIALDNLDAPLGGDLLCSALTQETVRVRILGASKTPDTPTSALFTATGNNLTLAGDMTRRSLLCRLDPQCERPELRRFSFDPLVEATTNRGRYLTAALTILRAYSVAGRPAQVQPLGSFGAWSGWVRSALLWLGMPDPCSTMEQLRANDPELTATRAVFSAWAAVIGPDRTVPAKAVIAAANDVGATFASGGEDAPAALLRESLLAVAGDGRGGIDSRKLGRWLAKQRGRIVSGYRLDEAPGRAGVAHWRLTTC